MKGLYNVVVTKFERHRWVLPSRIYSDSFDLFPGQKLNPKELSDRLDNLSYIKVERLPQNHGEYYQNKGEFEVYLHSFKYPHENFEGIAISIQIEEETIVSLKKSDKKEDLPLIALEPELIGSIFDENMEDRTFVSIKEIPQHLIDAIVVIEDKNFFSHFGIDPKGIIRAFIENFKAGKIVQGGSTLTQQLIKNFFLDSKRSYSRKANEAFMSIILDAKYTKEQILEAYLNEIYLGQMGAASVSGIAEASRFYFSKEVTQISIAEAALLAAVIPAPGAFSPFRNPERTKERRDYILSLMLEEEKISKVDYEQAVLEPLPQKSSRKVVVKAIHFMEFLKKQLKESFPPEILESEGLRIFTSLDMFLQRSAVKAMRDHLSDVESKKRILKKNVSNNVFLEGGFVALQPQTGFIRAYVGGRNYRRTQFDHVSGAKRQPGSAFKPFIFLTAMDPYRSFYPFTLATLLRDEELEFSSAGQVWRPKNYDKTFHGEVRARVALEKSYNVATVDLALSTGLENIIETARIAGIESDLKPYPSLALGAFEVSPLELASAYTIFPNQGVRTIPLAIRKVVTPEGKILEKKPIRMERVFSEDVIYIMNQLMRGVVDRGTAASSRYRGFKHIAAGKTGTTSDYRDAWFVGYTPDLLALSWVGYDDNRKTSLSGSSGALPIWVEFMKAATLSKDNKKFPVADNVTTVTIDKRTGLLPNPVCGDSMIEYFIQGTEPTESCLDKQF